MLLSLIFAWLTVLFCVLATLNWITKRMKVRIIRRLCRKKHISFGLLAVVTGLIHGILAGNMSTAGIDNFTFAPLLFTSNYGSFCFLCVILLTVTYLARKQLKKLWIQSHRILTVLLLVFLCAHLLEVGIQLPSRIKNGRTSNVIAEATNAMAQEPTMEETMVSKETEDPTAITVPEMNSISEETITESTEQSTESMETDAKDDEIESTEELVESLLFSGAVLRDGEYSGQADGYKGPITVSVTVEQGQVTNISIVENMDTPNFFESAKQIINWILSDQSLEVDTVSGATFSSAGILNAVHDALSSAVVSGELSITSVDLSNRGKHH